MKAPAIENPHVARVFEAYPPRIRKQLLHLREIIFYTACRTEGVGDLEETLKWGEPAYVTSETSSGSTIRIDWKPSTPKQYAMYFHCKTNLVEAFRTLFPEFEFEGNRAIVFRDGDAIAFDAVVYCVRASLTYHLKKKQSSRQPRNA